MLTAGLAAATTGGAVVVTSGKASTVSGAVTIASYGESAATQTTGPVEIVSGLSQTGNTGDFGFGSGKGVGEKRLLYKNKDCKKR